MFRLNCLISLCIVSAIPYISSKFSKKDKLELLKEIVGRYFLDVTDGNPKVAFAVSLTKHLSAVNAEVIKFDSILTNEGQGYNAATGSFTAPVPGMYQFSWHVLSYSNKKIHAFLYLNGIPKWRSYADDGPQGYDTGSGTVILRLKRGDNVQLRTSGTENYVYGDGFTTLAGTLLYR